jgi:hypothetical protein
MPFPIFATKFSSSFTGADENPISEGGNWENFSGWVVNATRTSNALTGAASDWWSAVCLPTQADGIYTDVEMIYKLTTYTDQRAVDMRLSPYSGLTLSNHNSYGFGSQAATIKIERVIANVPTILVSVADPYASGDLVGHQIIGNRLSWWRKVGAGAWTEVLATHDEQARLPAGRCSLGAFGLPVYDDFELNGLNMRPVHEYYDKLDRLK